MVARRTGSRLPRLRVRARFGVDGGLPFVVTGIFDSDVVIDGSTGAERHTPVRLPVMADDTFLNLPTSAWVASNDLAFAIRDNYPVSPGHTLVIPRRLVVTWDECTFDEEAALIELVAEVKQQLRDELHPDGFNMGVNEGAAAGQTVFHLHIHVIPRFIGDVPDPRGGIRHAVMGKGNWHP